MEYYEYITQEGERWDTLAYRWYGNAFLLTVLLAVNPHVPIVPVLPAGTLVFIPKLNIEQRTDNSKLPPWKRGVV
jgi:phage tail protein X